MGKADVAVRQWLSDKDRFADLFNGIMFHGERVVLPEELKERKGESDIIITDKEKKERAFQKYRDIVMLWSGKINLAVLAVEAQGRIHYAMPVRNMVYDSLDYAEQVRLVQKSHKGRYMASSEFLSGFGREDRIYPVVTLVFYYDTKEWDGAINLYEMMGLKDEIERHPLLRRYIPDYHINLVEAGKIENEEVFCTDLQEVLGMLKYRKDKDGLQKYINDNKAYFSNLDRDSYYANGSFLQSRRLLGKIEESGKERKEMRLDMCKALEELYEDGIEQGIKQGVEQGKHGTALNLSKMGMEIDAIARAVEADVSVVRSWIEDANVKK